MESKRRFHWVPVRFSLRHMLGVVVVATLLMGWYGYRAAYVQSEARAIAGEWVLVDERGNVVLLPNGEPAQLTVRIEEITVNPFTEPRQIDFRTSNGTSKAIYEWDGNRLRLLQSSPGLERPQSFADTFTDLEATGQGAISLTPYALRPWKE